MAQPIEQRVKSLEDVAAKLLLDNACLKSLCVALYLNHPEKSAVLDRYDFVGLAFSEMSLNSTISDSIREGASLAMKQFGEQLEKMGKAMDEQETKKR